jgi:uncharacterized tellurite resistance protein B-like protein
LDNLDLLKNLVVMSAADGSLAEEEISLLFDRCAELGLSEEDLEKAISFALSSEASLILPTDPKQQEAVLEDLIRMMAADGRLEESEKRLFALSAAKMGFPSEQLDALIDRLVRRPNPPADPGSSA